ncbi:MAG: hypothetical protein ACKOPO_01670 [Novosphingobium sp.]
MLPLWKLAPVEGFKQREFGTSTDIAHIRMLPAVMVELDSDYTQDNGRIAAPKGTQLIALYSRYAVACTIFPPKLALGAAIFALGTDRHLCFFDQNNDGKFDQYFFRQANEAGFFNLAEPLPAKLKTGSGGNYSKRDASQMTLSLDWTVSFQGCKLKKAKKLSETDKKICNVGINLSVPGFSGASMGSQWTNYGHLFELDLTNGPQPVKFFGADLLIEASGDAGIRASLVQEQPIKAFLLR